MALYKTIIYTVMVIKISVPTYYKKFKCIADKCPDTCCAGWEVDLDPESAERLGKVSGEIGDKLRRALIKDSDGDYIFEPAENDRCPFLDGSNLCELILTLGEESICPTCKLFPRFYDDFGSFREMGLGLGCPEAARIILNENETFELIEYGETEEIAEAVDENFLFELLLLRKKLFNILDNTDMSFKKKISAVLNTCRQLQYEICDCAELPADKKGFEICTDILGEMEYIDEKRRELFISLTDEGFDRGIYDECDDFIKLMKYYIFRYMLKAVYDGDVLTKVKYGVFACAVIGRLYTVEPDRIKAQYGYSKEVEYSCENLDILDTALYEKLPCESLIELF